MKKYIFAFVLMLLPASAFATPTTLISDKLSANAEFVSIMVNGIEVADCGSVVSPCVAPAPGGGVMVSYDITQYLNTGTPVEFKAQACNSSGFCSLWSQPYTADLDIPNLPTGLKVIVKVIITTTQ